MTDDVYCRSARSWEEVRRTAVTAGRSFDGRWPEGSFFRARTIDAPALPLENTLVVEADGRLAGAMHIYDRAVAIGDGIVSAGAIGNVHVLPEFRQKGLATRLLEYSHKFMTDRGYAFSILLGDPALYGKHGWTTVPHEEVVVASPDQVDGGDLARLRPYRHDDLDAIRERYSTERDGVSGRFRRPATLWTDWILAPETAVVDPDQIRVYEEDGRVAGYLVLDQEDSTAECLEYAYDGTERERFLRTCWNAVATSANRVTWRPPFSTAIADDIDAAVERRTDDHVMICGYDWATLSALAGRPVRETADLVAVLADGPWYWSALDGF